MKRTRKRYAFSTSAVNNYKYRVLSAGGDLDQYRKNPILLWMHIRAFGASKDQILPLGRAVDIQLNGDEWSCYLEFDESDPFALQIYNKYENETLNMLSLGALPLELSMEPDDMLPGQTGPTVTKWKATDISCVDIGGQDDACACQLYDANDKRIELADLTGDGLIKLYKSLQPKNDDNDMKLIQLTGPALNGILLALKLKEDATEVQVQEKVNEVIQLNATLTTQVGSLTSEKNTADAKVIELQAEVDKGIKLANEAKVNGLVEGAITTKKILPGQKDSFIKLANADFESTKAILDGMAGTVSVQERINLSAADNTEVDALIKLSYDELWRDGKLERLQKLDNEAYLAKRAERFPVGVAKR